MKILLRKVVVVALLMCTACSSYTNLPAGTVLEVSTQDAVVEQTLVEVPKMVSETPPEADYRIGSGDVLYVNVQGKPEMGSPVVAGNGNNRVGGSRVDGNGNIHLPLIGMVSVAGLSISAAQELLSKKFSVYLNQPWVVVEIAEYRSQPVYLLGQFRNAGAFYLDRPYTLVQGVSLAGGLLDTANLRSARLIRGDKTLPVDIYAMLQEGDVSQNIWLRAGDTLFVPDDKNQNVFVFGAVRRPGPVPMPNGQLNLAQALATADINEARGQGRYVRIIRSLSATKGQLLVVDLERVLRGDVLPVWLREGDILYVPRSGVGNWNDALAEILPSLTTASAILQPFVHIKYLEKN